MSEVVRENAYNASQYLRTLDNTIVDVLRNDLYHETTERVRKKNRQWFNQKGALELLEICGKSCSSPAFRKAVCELATKFLTQELDGFISSGNISQPTTTITPETLTNFSAHALSKTMMRDAPLLSGLFQSLVTGDRVKTPETSICGDDQEEEEEEMFVEGRKEKKERIENQQTNRWVMSLSIICFAKNRFANLQQQVIGYYLVSANTSKRVLEVLCQLGISVSYKSVVRSMKTIAKIAMEILRKFPIEHPQFWFSKDNMDYMARARDPRFDHQGGLQHDSAGYAAINLISHGKDGEVPTGDTMLTKDDINMLNAKNISAFDIIPPNEDIPWLKNGTYFGLYSVLRSYCGESMSLKSSGKELKPVKLWTVYQIPIQKTYVGTLPVYARNEGELAQMCELLRDIMKTLGLSADNMADMKIFSDGDLFTVLKER